MTIPQILQYVLLVLMFTAPALVLPLVLWIVIHFTFRQDPFQRLAGPFTLKPVIATLLWALILLLDSATELPGALVNVLTLIPGVGLTLLIVRANLDLFRSEPRLSRIFLAVDTLRWVSTFLWVEFDRSIQFNGPLYWLAMLMPGIFALMALVVMWSRRRASRLAGIGQAVS